LVVGAGGYLGHHVLSQLRTDGVEAIGTARDPAEGDGDGMLRLDIRFPYHVLRTIERVRPTAVVCLAYVRTSGLAADPQMGLETDVMGINAVFDACVAIGVPLVVYASSINVYGRQSDFGSRYVTESVHGLPDSLYGWVKQLNEALANHYTETTTTQFVGLRFSGIHGWGRPDGFNPYDQIVNAAREGTSLSLPWSGALEVSFVHVKDAACSIASIVSAGRAEWPVYNCAARAVTMESLGDIAEAVCGTHVSFTDPGQSILAVSRVDSSRLIAEFGVSLESAEVWLNRELDPSYTASIRG
jgi:nucleoside-diphosphate-sugar epimerase